MVFLLNWAHVFLRRHARLLHKHPFPQNTASQLGFSAPNIIRYSLGREQWSVLLTISGPNPIRSTCSWKF